MNPSLQENNLFRSDPIAYLLKEKLNLSPLSFGLWSIAIAVTLLLFTGLVSNTLRGRNLFALSSSVVFSIAVFIIQKDLKIHND